MLENSEAEILNEYHRLLSYVTIVELDETNKILSIKVPRNEYGRPIPFSYSKIYNVIHNSDSYITFAQVKLEGVSNVESTACYSFTIDNLNKIKNIRKEERNNVEVEAVASNFEKAWIVTVLDLSESGLKIESEIPISSEFIELFFDDANTPRRASGKIIWEKPGPNNNFLYGVKLNSTN